MPFQIKQNTLNLSVPIERLAGAYYRIQRTKQNISLSCLAKELRMNISIWNIWKLFLWKATIDLRYL